ncbi:leukocyte cysteine proteinase inhibitor 1-like [Pagrus major]|uniref:leukocyte cysteine proteinase inhibitor 1-like n=1 Tax=Pagrus major TaxID=143350 RepID=UPI003CC8515A
MDIKVGAWSHTSYADKETQCICDQVKSLVEGKTNKIYQEFKAALSRNHIEDRKNFLIKVRVGERNYIHLQVYQARPCNGGWLQLSGVQEDKTQDDGLEPFNN